MAKKNEKGNVEKLVWNRGLIMWTIMRHAWIVTRRHTFGGRVKYYRRHSLSAGGSNIIRTCCCRCRFWEYREWTTSVRRLDENDGMGEGMGEAKSKGEK